MKRSMGFVAAMLAAALSAVVIQAPAQAAPKPEKYYAVGHVGDTLAKWFWIDEIDGVIGCERCFWLVDLGYSVQPPLEIEKAFQEQLMAGMGKMSEAHVQRDPGAADRLRQEALVSFTSAARTLGSIGVRPGVVGYYDELKRAVVPASRAWLSAADQDLADGIGLLQRSLTDPSPQPWIDAALGEFTEAYQEIAGKKAI